MYRQDRVLRLVGLIYDATLDPERWSDFLSELVETVNGHSASLWSVRPGGALAMLTTARMDPEFIEQYTAHYCAKDPWLIKGRERNLFRPGVVRLGEEVVTPSELRSTEFFNDFGRRFRSVGGAATVFGSQSTCGTVSIMQHEFGQFGAHEHRLLTALSPHMERALAIGRRLEDGRAAERTTAEILEHLPLPAIVVDKTARPLLMNAAARGLRGGLQSARDGIVTGRANETRVLRELVRSCDTASGDGVDAGGTMIVTRERPSPDLHVTVMPIRRTMRVDGPDAQAAVALLIVRDPSSRVAAMPARLSQWFGLTPAEARVASLLAEGRTIAEVAAILHVTHHTVRTHVKRALQKTQTRTQAQLVRVVLTHGQ